MPMRKHFLTLFRMNICEMSATCSIAFERFTAKITNNFFINRLASFICDLFTIFSCVRHSFQRFSFQRALSGTRTHTLQILSLLPLPIGLLGPARIGRRYHSCLTQTITFGLLYPSGPLGSYFRLLFAAYIGPITLRCTVAFYTVNNHSLFSFC